MKLITKDERCDTPRTSPVALRTNNPDEVVEERIVDSGSLSTDDMAWTPFSLPGSCEASGCLRRLARPVCQLADDELPHGDVVVAQFHESPVDATTGVVGSRVDTRGAPDGGDAAGFVDMAVEGQQRLV